MRRAMTLVEVLVAGGCMLVLMTAVLAIYQSGQDAQTKLDAHTEAYRQAMLALAHVKSELRGAQLLSPALGKAQQASFRHPSMVDGHLEVDPDGLQIWAGTTDLNQDVLGHFYKQDQGSPDMRVLADLGPRGKVTFERLAPKRLRVHVIAEHGQAEGHQRQKSRYEIAQDIFMSNQ